MATINYSFNLLVTLLKIKNLYFVDPFGLLFHDHANANSDWSISETKAFIFREKQSLYPLGNTKDLRFSNMW